MHDFAALSADGVRAAVVASSPFRAAADVQGRALGYAEVPAVYVPHPIQDRTDAEMVALADAALPALRAALLAGPPGS